MAKSAFEARTVSTPGQVAPPSLSPSVRRKLGSGLRSVYADTLSAPISERLEALLARLDQPKR